MSMPTTWTMGRIRGATSTPFFATFSGMRSIVGPKAPIRTPKRVDLRLAYAWGPRCEEFHDVVSCPTRSACPPYPHDGRAVAHAHPGGTLVCLWLALRRPGALLGGSRFDRAGDWVHAHPHTRGGCEYLPVDRDDG